MENEVQKDFSLEDLSTVESLLIESVLKEDIYRDNNFYNHLASIGCLGTVEYDLKEFNGKTKASIYMSAPQLFFKDSDDILTEQKTKYSKETYFDGF